MGIPSNFWLAAAALLCALACSRAGVLKKDKGNNRGEGSVALVEPPPPTAETAPAAAESPPAAAATDAPKDPEDEPADKPTMVSGGFLACESVPGHKEKFAPGTNVFGCKVETAAGPVKDAVVVASVALIKENAAPQPVVIQPPGADSQWHVLYGVDYKQTQLNQVKEVAAEVQIATATAQSMSTKQGGKADFVDQDVAFVTMLYRHYLNREPDPGGLASWVSNLKLGSQNRITTEVNFRCSKEYLFRRTFLHCAHAEPPAVDALMATYEDAEDLAEALNECEYEAEEELQCDG